MVRPVPHDFSGPTLFSNGAEAQAFQRNRGIKWHPPSNDTTIPRTNAQRGAYVIRMRRAMVDVSRTTETSKHFIERWKQPLQNGQRPLPHSLVSMEATCWELLDLAERLHTQGPICLSIYDPSALKAAGKYRHLTFSQRIDALIEELLYSKKTVDGLMRTEGHAMFVACCRHKPANRRQDKKIGMREARPPTLDEGVSNLQI